MAISRITAFAVLTAFLLQNFVFLLPVQARPAAPLALVSPDIVISQVYGGGGNSGATYTNDFIELFNRGTMTVNITGWSVQYASSTGTTWSATAISGSIPAGGYYLVQQAAGAGGTTPLPTPDAIGTIAMSGTNAKVALSTSTTALTGSCPTGLVDLVGYGSANCFEGTAATPALTNTTSAIRAGNGCTDTDQNSTDFSTGAPIPRNSSSPQNPCGGGGPTNPTGVGAANPSTVNAGGSTLLTVTVTPGTMPTSTGLTVSGDLTTIGGSATQTFFDDGSNGDVTPADNIFSYNATVGGMTTGGGKMLPASITDAQMRMGSATINLTVTAPPGPVNHVVISQVYGGGGNSGATYLNDYVELYNPTMSSVDLTGWSLQYSSATGSFWSGVQPIGGPIGPGEYYLISLASGGANGAALPTANILGDINISSTAGKVALVNTSAMLADGCPTGNMSVIDFVGYGTSANCREGANNAPAPSNTTADLRKSNGAQDTDDNGADFLAGTPNPRRTSPITEIGPAVFNTDPQNNNNIAPRDASMTITFTEPVFVDPNWFDITCASTGQHNSATEAGSSKVYVITPNVNFLAGETCTVTIFKDFVHDQDTDDTAPNTDTLAADYVWSFTVATGTAPPYFPDVHLTMGNPSGALTDTNQPNNYLMQKPELALSYNRDRGIPNWVSWHLATEWTGSLVRIDTFRPDPEVPSNWYRVQATDYFGSGFDRGHMTPNADRDFENSRPINQATFLMTNMVPQAPDNNQGPWANMENDLRALMTTNELYIVSGGAGTGGTGLNGGVTNTLAGGNVSVPGYTWKAALILPIGTDDLSRVDNNTRIISVIMPNSQGIRTDDWRKYLATVDQIEAMTGYDLFSNVPAAIQDVIESRLDAASDTGPQLVTGGSYTDLNITSPQTSLTGDVTVTGNLTLGGSHLTTGMNKIILGPNATVSRLGGYVIGNVEKQFENPPVFAPDGVSLGNFQYPVGTANGYSPVTANITALGQSPSSLTVKAVQGTQPNLPYPDRGLGRYWTLTETGDLTANITFKYIDADIPAGTMEDSLVIQRYNGSFATIPTFLDSMANTATALGISEFSDWTLVAPFGPTAANVTVGGRVFSSNGRGVFGAVLTMIDPSGQTRTARTNSLGYFRFYDVAAGTTYSVDVRHKSHNFAPRIVSVSEDFNELNFMELP